MLNKIAAKFYAMIADRTGMQAGEYAMIGAVILLIVLVGFSSLGQRILTVINQVAGGV